MMFDSVLNEQFLVTSTKPADVADEEVKGSSEGLEASRDRNAFVKGELEAISNGVFRFNCSYFAHLNRCVAFFNQALFKRL